MCKLVFINNAKSPFWVCFEDTFKNYQKLFPPTVIKVLRQIKNNRQLISLPKPTALIRKHGGFNTKVCKKIKNGQVELSVMWGSQSLVIGETVVVFNDVFLNPLDDLSGLFDELANIKHVK